METVVIYWRKSSVCCSIFFMENSYFAFSGRSLQCQHIAPVIAKAEGRRLFRVCVPECVCALTGVLVCAWPCVCVCAWPCVCLRECVRDRVCVSVWACEDMQECMRELVWGNTLPFLSWSLLISLPCGCFCSAVLWVCAVYCEHDVINESWGNSITAPTSCSAESWSCCRSEILPEGWKVLSVIAQKSNCQNLIVHICSVSPKDPLLTPYCCTETECITLYTDLAPKLPCRSTYPHDYSHSGFNWDYTWWICRN